MYDIKSVWPEWQIVRLIGEGSYGKVYEIIRNRFSIEEHSALKVISIPMSQAELQSFRNDGMDEKSITSYYYGLVESFVHEIALMQKLKGNSHIVDYQDYTVVKHKDSIGWDILIRMELLIPLPQYINANGITEKGIAVLGSDMCDALSFCHRNNVIHRDIKPDNIFVTELGIFKLGDFGVARTVEKTMSELSRKGTYTYMAPEVYKGRRYDQTVDIYSLGIVLYKMLNCNRAPFLPLPPEPVTYTAKNESIVKRMNGERISVPVNASKSISAAVLKACAYNPKDRYQNAGLMKHDLQNALAFASDKNLVSFPDNGFNAYVQKQQLNEEIFGETVVENNASSQTRLLSQEDLSGEHNRNKTDFSDENKKSLKKTENSPKEDMPYSEKISSDKNSDFNKVKKDDYYTADDGAFSDNNNVSEHKETAKSESKFEKKRKNILLLICGAAVIVLVLCISSLFFLRDNISGTRHISNPEQAADVYNNGKVGEKVSFENAVVRLDVEKEMYCLDFYSMDEENKEYDIFALSSSSNFNLADYEEKFVSGYAEIFDYDDPNSNGSHTTRCLLVTSIDSSRKLTEEEAKKAYSDDFNKYYSWLTAEEE